MEQKEMNTAERIVWHFSGPGRLDEWKRRLPNRPDWQADIEYVKQLIQEEKANA